MNAETPAEIRTAVLLSHTQPEQTSEAVGKALAAAKAHGCRLYAPASELAKQGDAAAGIASLTRLDGQTRSARHA